jgi:ABC-type transport system involved in cytochrome c biogenesis permease subunit
MVHRAFFWPILAMILYGEGLIITGIVMRCVIRDRPPVTTPYEAVLFIAACVLLITLAIEFIFRNGFALIAAAGFGCVGMMVAAWHEAAESADSMAPLVAVLDTNFWLATHVTMITLGYAAGVFAAFLAHFYLIAKLFSVFGVGGGDLKKFCSVVSRVIYGVLCFGLVFAIVGTILGGVWANDSWGRFWGWDPKENGALMLVLVYLAIAHARMGGYIREIGLAISSLIVGITVMWAFWGVNLLQIGLHSYGFDETKARAWAYYRWTEWTVVGLGVVVWGLNRWMTASAGAKAAA